MDSPFKSSTDPDVISEEAARFRAMSPEEQMRCIRKVLADGARALRQSPIADFLRGYHTEQRELDRKAFKQFIAQQLAREKRN